MTVNDLQNSIYNISYSYRYMEFLIKIQPKNFLNDNPLRKNAEFFELLLCNDMF